MYLSIGNPLGHIPWKNNYYIVYGWGAASLRSDQSILVFHPVLYYMKLHCVNQIKEPLDKITLAVMKGTLFLQIIVCTM